MKIKEDNEDKRELKKHWKKYRSVQCIIINNDGISIAVKRLPYNDLARQQRFLLAGPLAGTQY